MKLITCMLILALGTHTFARPGKGLSILDEMDLSKDQIEKISSYKQQMKQNREASKEVRKKHRKKMKELFLAGAPDAELRKLHESIEESKNSHSSRKLERMIFLKNLLTKDQREAYLEKQKEERKQKRRSRRNQ